MPSDVTGNYVRFRIRRPSYFDNRSFRTIDPGKKGFMKLIIGCKQGEYHKGRCNIGTQTQAMLLNRKNFKMYEAVTNDKKVS